RTNPGPVTEAHRMKVLEPLALPDAVGHRPHLDAHRVEPERGAERARDGRRIALAGEQAPQARPRPETKLPGGGLEHRGPHEIRRLVEWRGVRVARWAGFRGVVYGIIARVDEGQRARAARPAGPFRSLGVHRPEIERELEIHGGIMRRHRNRTRRAGLFEARRVPQPDRPRRGHEGLRVLGVDAAFQGVTADLHVALAVGQPLTRGDQQLRLHEIDAGDELGDGMLDLDARVHLDEVELPVLVEELHGAGAAVADRAARLHAPLAHEAALARREAGRRRLLEHLLVAPLHGAIALAEVN